MSEYVGLRGAWEIAFPNGANPAYEVLSHMRTWYMTNPLRMIKLLQEGHADEIMQVVGAVEWLKDKQLPCPKWEALQVTSWFPNVLQKEFLLPLTDEEKEAKRSLMKKFKAAGVPC